MIYEMFYDVLRCQLDALLESTNFPFCSPDYDDIVFSWV